MNTHLKSLVYLLFDFILQVFVWCVIVPERSVTAMSVITWRITVLHTHNHHFRVTCLFKCRIRRLNIFTFLCNISSRGTDCARPSVFILSLLFLTVRPRLKLYMWIHTSRVNRVNTLFSLNVCEMLPVVLWLTAALPPGCRFLGPDREPSLRPTHTRIYIAHYRIDFI